MLHKISTFPFQKRHCINCVNCKMAITLPLQRLSLLELNADRARGNHYLYCLIIEADKYFDNYVLCYIDHSSGVLEVIYVYVARLYLCINYKTALMLQKINVGRKIWLAFYERQPTWRLPSLWVLFWFYSMWRDIVSAYPYRKKALI